MKYWDPDTLQIRDGWKPPVVEEKILTDFSRQAMATYPNGLTTAMYSMLHEMFRVAVKGPKRT